MESAADERKRVSEICGPNYFSNKDSYLIEGIDISPESKAKLFERGVMCQKDPRKTLSPRSVFDSLIE